MFVSMIAALAQPAVLAVSLYSSAESVATVVLPQIAQAAQAAPTAPAARVASVEPAAATKEELAEITAPGINLSHYLTPAGKASMCAALAKALGTSSAPAASNLALRDCYPESASYKTL